MVVTTRSKARKNKVPQVGLHNLLPNELIKQINNQTPVSTRFAFIVPVSVWDPNQAEIKYGYQLHYDNNAETSYYFHGLGRVFASNRHKYNKTLNRKNINKLIKEEVAPFINADIIYKKRKNGVEELYANKMFRPNDRNRSIPIHERNMISRKIPRHPNRSLGMLKSTSKRMHQLLSP